MAGGTTIEGTLTVTVSSTKLSVALPAGVSAAVIAGLEGNIATRLAKTDPALGGFVRSANQMPFTTVQLAQLDAVGAHMTHVYLGKTIGTVTADYRALLLATLFAFVASIDSYRDSAPIPRDRLSAAWRPVPRGAKSSCSGLARCVLPPWSPA